MAGDVPWWVTNTISAKKYDVDWHSSMQQSFEFYKVDPNTWRDVEKITEVESCTITRDSTAQTLGSATFDVGCNLDECYIRVYLVTIQNDYTNRFVLGTFLIQSPTEKFDGKRTSYSYDAYTPLIELKESYPPIGYSVLKDTEIMPLASTICREHMRAPVVTSTASKKLYSNFVAELSDTWLSFLSDFVANANYSLSLDEMGQVVFEPIVDTASLQPVKEFKDDEISILLPDAQDDRDLYGIPNVVEVVYSSDSLHLYSKVVNDDVSSPISTVNRGREIVYRDSSPSFNGTPTQEVIDAYAKQLLREQSCLEHTVTFEHAYYPVRIGDAVMLNYKRAGLKNIIAKITSQTIKCSTGCTIQETATYTTKLWR